MADLNEEKGQAPTPKNEVDLEKILLPKKEGAPSVQKPAESPSAVQSLQTFKGDIARVVNDRGSSVVSIAAAEADRRSAKHSDGQEIAQSAPQKHWLFTLAAAGGGVLLLAAAGGLLFFVLTREISVPAQLGPEAPFIAVDNTSLVPLGQGASRVAYMAALDVARKNVHLPVGLVERLYLSTEQQGDTAPAALSTREFFRLLFPNAPEELTRTLSGAYLLGVHSFDENQALLLFAVDSYETAYAGMLKWEVSMYTDLSPLFIRTPAVRLPTIPAIPAIEDIGSSTSVIQTAAERFLPTAFVDKIAENRDTRAIVSPQGDILFLWTFLGRNTVLVTTNEYTLREVIGRMQTAPAIPLPGQ